jgi:hypothetical protein
MFPPSFHEGTASQTLESGTGFMPRRDRGRSPRWSSETPRPTRWLTGQDDREVIIGSTTREG